MSLMNPGQGVHWTMVVTVLMVVRAFGLTIDLPVATAAVVQPFHFPQATTLASCMASCASKLDLKKPSDESCRKHGVCHSCVGMCRLLISEPDTRGRTCRDERCARGCQIACDHTISHSTRSAHPAHTWNFAHKPSLTLSGRTTLRLSWSKPRPRSMQFKKSVPILAYVLMYRDSHGDWASFYATFDTKITAKLPRMTADFRLIAVSATGVATSTVINFKDSPNEDNLDMVTEDESSGEVPSGVFPTKPQPPPGIFHSIEAHIRRLRSNKFDMVVSWHQELRHGLENVDYHVKWVRIECHDKHSTVKCPPSAGQYGSVVQAIGHKRMHVTLKSLRFNSQYDLEIGFPTFPSQHLLVDTPRCAHPDASYRRCLTTHQRGHPTPAPKATTTKGKSSIFTTMTSIPAYDVPTTDLGSNAAPEVRKFDQHGDHAQKNPIVAQEEGLILDEKDHQNKQKGKGNNLVIVSLSAALGGVLFCLVLAVFAIYGSWYKARASFNLENSNLWATVPGRPETFQNVTGNSASYNIQPVAENDNNQQSTSLWAMLTQHGEVEHRSSTPKSKSGGPRLSGHMPCGRLLSTDLPGSLQFQPLSPANDECCVGQESITRKSSSQYSFKKSFISPRPNIDSLGTPTGSVEAEEVGNVSLIHGDNDLRYHLVSIPSCEIEQQTAPARKVNDHFFTSHTDLDESFSSGLPSENGESFLESWISHFQGRARKDGTSDYIEVAQDDNEGENQHEEDEKQGEEETDEGNGEEEKRPLRRGSYPTLQTFKSESYTPRRSISSPSVRQNE